ncbi:MAG: alanine--tRNA ligase [Pseudomonadota bacterium]
MIKSTSEIREAFLTFFESKQHTRVTSSPLVPGNDPTLLFTNAGMVQFKDVFLGHESRDYQRAVTSQRCVRAGGKHNDLDNVGYTARHHTFFEMLGNFSFGDYFKRDAIFFAWEFLTQILKLPEERLWVTVYKDDKEAEDIWFNEVGIDQTRFSRLGEKDNFWSMGDTGPCGPCTEIFYDHGEEVAGGPPGSPDEDADRYIEVWNLVFMQFNRDASGKMTPLPKPSVDTGMGLERIAAVMQFVHSNYDIDIFQHLIHKISSILNVKDKTAQSLRVIADHIRSSAFLIVDGVLPSNEGRGYVLRRIIRRAIRHGHKLGANEPFFYRAVQPLIEAMGEAYPELNKLQSHIEKALKLEEEQFLRTLAQGLKIFESEIKTLTNKALPGQVIFKLYDTYGFPVDLTADLARERGLSLEMDDYHKLMDKQKQQASAGGKFSVDLTQVFSSEQVTTFDGYEQNQSEATVIGLYDDAMQPVSALQSGMQGALLLSNTPFYAESGGQVGDTGTIRSVAGAKLEVLDTQKANQAFLHKVKVVSGQISTNDTIEAAIDSTKRNATALNHSATHLLHAALRQVLGEHVTQKGSLCDHDKLRFDFSHLQAVSREELLKIESLVNQHIRFNHTVVTEVMSPDAAQSRGAMALFGEKYGEKVRVLSMGDFSCELCGGTHVIRTGDIGTFKIISEMGIAAGIRRIEAVTGEKAMEFIARQQNSLQEIAARLKSDTESVVDKVLQLQERNKQLEKEAERLKSKVAASIGSDLASQARAIGEVKVLIAIAEGVEPKALRDTVEQLKQKLKSGVILLASPQKNKVQLIAGITKDLTKKVKAGDFVNQAAVIVGGKGGGRPDMAMAGGNQPDKVNQALQVAEEWLLKTLDK